MKIEKLSITVFLIGFFCFVTAFSQENSDTVMTPQKRANIEKIIKMVKADDMTKHLAESILLPYKNMLTKVPDGYWDKLSGMMPMDSLLNDIANVWNMAFSSKEIDELIIMFESPTGKKFFDLIQTIGNKTWELTEKWGSNASAKIRSQVKKDGFINADEPD